MKYHDPFLFESLETITSVEYEGDTALLEFSDTIFYPGGGGQPSDKGIIIIKGEEIPVMEVFKDKTIVKHKIKVPKNMDIKPGLPVELKIDSKRRQRLMRMHTGEHLFIGSLQRIIPEVKVDKIHLEEEESSVFVIPPKNRKLTWKDIFRAEENTNRIIKENRKVIIHLLNKEEVPKKFPNARIKLDLIKSDNIRIIEIDEYDYAACAGVHCTTTGFIGNLLVTRFNQAKDRYEIRFGVNADLAELSRYAREAASVLKVNPSLLVEFSQKLLQERDELKKSLREAISKEDINIREEQVKDVKIRYAEVENLDKKQLNDKLNDNFGKGREVLIIFNRTGKGTQFSMKISEKLGDISEIIKALHLKGGGKGSFASGLCENTSEFIEKIKSHFY